VKWLSAAWSIGSSIPSLLTGGYGILIRLGIIAAIAAGIFVYGRHLGFKEEEKVFDAYRQQVVVDGKVAAIEAKNTKDRQDKNTQEITDAHAQDVSRIRAFYAGQLRSRPGGCPMSAPADSAGRPDAAPAESRPGGASAQRDTAFELKCALDAEQVMKLQDFLRENGFPVQ
jgi:hypothetical protein